VRAVNLIPPERRTGASVGLGRSGGGAYGVLALVAVLAFFVFLYGSARHSVSSKHAQAQKLTAEATQAQNEAGNLAKYNGLISESLARTVAVEQLVDSRFDWAHAFHEVGRVLPKDVSISSLTGQVGSEKGSSGKTASTGTVSSATPAGSIPSFTLTGCATSQTTVAQLLERLRLIDGVKEATLQSSVSAVNSGSGSGGSSSGAGSCPGTDPSFSVMVTFEPLPTVAPKPTTNVSDNTGSTK
jgi:Tfp pilus assembly protein PilN